MVNMGNDKSKKKNILQMANHQWLDDGIHNLRIARKELYDFEKGKGTIEQANDISRRLKKSKKDVDDYMGLYGIR